MRLNRELSIKARRRLPFGSVNVPGQSGYSPGLQRHHLVPRQLLRLAALTQFVAKLGVERLGIHDFRRNGQLLPASEDVARRIGMPLNTRDPALDFSHFDEMVDLFWSETGVEQHAA